MRKTITKMVVALSLIILSMIALLISTNKMVKAETETIEYDWMPFNYVLTDGFGSQMRYNDVRTDVSTADGKITFSGRTTKGGMGGTYLPEITLDGFKLNVSINSWQDVSPDRWFGMTLTDVLQKNDEYNELPFYSKHSESWSVDYGAGILFAFRPGENGAMQIQFNFIGINASLDGDGNIASNAGEYNDGFLGWAGWLSTIQLYNTDWTVKEDYSDIDIEIKAIKEAGLTTGYYFEINDGYWKRTDAVDWSNLAQDVFQKLDADKNGTLSETEKENFMYGPAWETSIVEYASWGETFRALVNYERYLKENNKRLYLSFMYKDTWDLRDGVDDASFTINSINDKQATTMTSFDLTNEKEISGKISGKITNNMLHAGVYPEYVDALNFVELEAKAYKQAVTAIEGVAQSRAYKVVCVKGVTKDNKQVSLVDTANLKMNLSDYKNAKLYKIVGEELNEITDLEKVKVSSSSTQFVIVYDNNSQAKTGCKNSFGMTSIVFALPISVAFFIKKKEEN